MTLIEKSVKWVYVRKNEWGVLTEHKIRPSYKREPWANTLAYLPLATDTNDHKWFPPIYNWYRNLYVSYSNNRAVFNSNWQWCITFDDWPTNNTFTLHMIAQITTLSWYQLAFRYSDSGGYDNCRCYLNWYGSIQLWMANWNTQLTWILADTNEHLYSWVVQSNQMKFYIDWVLKYTYSANVWSYSWAKLSLWNRWYNTNEWLKGTMREVILESTYRTDAEVLALAKQFWFA